MSVSLLYMCHACTEMTVTACKLIKIFMFSVFPCISMQKKPSHHCNLSNFTLKCRVFDFKAANFRTQWPLCCPFFSISSTHVMTSQLGYTPFSSFQFAHYLFIYLFLHCSQVLSHISGFIYTGLSKRKRYSVLIT